tara:strand:- start:1994 stop:2524 length:531 start_codon:yes stop_codon:yes gene_type:complete
MKNFGIIIILLLNFSCSEKKTDPQIAEFEKILGERQTNALNLLVSDFEKNLTEIYPNLNIDKAYRQYLIDIKSDTITDWKKFEFQSNKTHAEYIKSGLRNEIYDKDTTSLKENNFGRYMEALFLIRNSDSVIKKYWSKREALGIMDNIVFVDGFLYSNPDFNNYFHKRIAIIEFSF